jgi:hypothetical protein
VIPNLIPTILNLRHTDFQRLPSIIPAILWYRKAVDVWNLTPVAWVCSVGL